MPKVSIITASYNSEEFINAAYDSLVSQTYGNWEWLVTDDCSVDNTYSKLLQLSKIDDRVKVFRNPKNLGAAVSRNSSLNRVSGEFIAFLDSDDLWLKDKLEVQVGYMRRLGCDFSFTAYEIVDLKGNRLGKTVDLGKAGTFSYKDMLCKKATLGCSTVMVRSEFLGEMRMPLIRTGQDYAFWLSLLKKGTTASLISRVLTQYRIVPNSISRNKVKKSRRQWQIYRDIEGLNFFDAVWCFTNYALRAVFR